MGYLQCWGAGAESRKPGAETFYRKLDLELVTKKLVAGDVKPFLVGAGAGADKKSQKNGSQVP